MPRAAAHAAREPNVHERTPDECGCSPPALFRPRNGPRGGRYVPCSRRELMLRPPALHVSTLPLLMLAAACGSGARTGGVGPAQDLVVIGSEPLSGSRLQLGDAFSIDVSAALDPVSLQADAFTFQVFDGDGAELAESVEGTFELGTASGDTAPGRRVTFLPRLPTATGAAGLRAGRRYVVTIRGGDEGPLRGIDGARIAATSRFEFTTVTGTTNRELYRDTRKGGPARAGFAVAPLDGELATLSLLGRMPVEVRLRFDQPLDPSPENLPLAPRERGRVWLEYDDPERGPGTWLPTTCELVENTQRGSTLVLRPIGVLPNAAAVRVVVSPELQDLSGEANTSAPGYDPLFGGFATQAGYEPRFAAVVAHFDAESVIDPDAAFVEPRAEVGPGYVRASLDFAGGAPQYDFEPTQREVVLNTDFTQVIPKVGAPFNVTGGVFAFRNVHIPAGCTVRGNGSKPMVWLVSGEVRIDGQLMVNGGEGSLGHRLTQYRGPGDVLRNTNGGVWKVPTPGGVGGCGGGDGGAGSANMNGPTYPETQPGFGSGQARGLGGGGGRMACLSACGGRASGGGGGSFATQGDPGFKVAKPATPATSFVQVLGRGGYGCTGSSGAGTRTLAGGSAGPLAFTDLARDNDFWGQGFDVRRQVRIAGELPALRGGSGGGGGGDSSSTNTCSTNNPSWLNDYGGGGGGGGGGVLLIQALGPIELGPMAHVSADGGNGNGGTQAGSNNIGAGGGGGSGGMVVLASGVRIRIHTHGGTYTDNDFDFAISADGGVSLQSPYVSTAIEGKYTTLHAAATWDATPTGGFGGMGVVQLMAPAGDNRDGTNTILDDNIELVRDGTTVLSGAEKMRYLCWPGFPNEQGVLVDDAGNPTALARTAGGDIRPNPVLLPAPFGARSKARSAWIDTGATQRRELASADGAPRGIVPEVHDGVRYGAGPVFAFEGTFPAGDPREGFLAYETLGVGIAPRVRTLLPATAVTGIDASARFEGQAAYEVTLGSPALGVLRDRFANARCELLPTGGALLADLRILGHDATRLWLAPEALLPDLVSIAAARVVARAVDLATDGASGFGGARPLVSGGVAPPANVRIGFAFHADPSRALTSGVDPLRYPSRVGAYVYDLSDPGVAAETRMRPFLQFEVLFDLLFAESLGAAAPRVLASNLPRPELRGLVVPFRF